MLNHLSPEKRLAYIEGKLPPLERITAWKHLRDCSRCAALVRSEEQVQRHLKQEIGTLGRVVRRDDLSALLPGILAETRRPVVPIPFNLRAFALALIMISLTMLPIVPFINGIPLQAMEVYNAPHATSTAQQIVTEETPSANETLPITFNIEYASPAPLPHATADASLTPR